MDNAFLSQAVRVLTGEHMTPAYIEHKLALAGLTPPPEPGHPTEALPDPEGDGGMSIKEALDIAKRLKDQLAGKGLDALTGPAHPPVPNYEAVWALGVICRHLEQRIPARN
jgi:hypothetical protein